jgi:aminoglycoside phosphotransferase (APT) family kinase protein
MSDVIVAPEVRDLDILARQLSRWMGQRLDGASDITIANLAYPRGAGQSHETILFDARYRQAGRDHELGCVVRIRPEAFTVFPDNLFEEQYLIMKALHEDGRVRVAEPFWLERDPTILGKPFFVMRKVDGRVPVSIPPYSRSGWMTEATVAQRRTLWHNAVTQLALIQTIADDRFSFLEGPEGARRGLLQEWDKYTRFVDWLEETAPQPILRAAMDRLKGLWPEHQPSGLVWGDARIGNMMFDENCDVVAVMDWEQPSLGGALHDLAWFCVIAETMHGPRSTYGAPLEGMGSHDETVALWEEVSGKSAKGLEWYEAFAEFKMTCTGVRLGHLRGTQMMDDETMRRRLKVA